VFPDDSSSGITDGTIGAWYLASRIWTFDYPGHRLLLEDADWKASAQATSAPLGFPQDDAGHIAVPYPRIAIKVAGQTIDLLLDTGATGHPSEAARQVEKADVAADGFAGGSYITTSLMNRWHVTHPEWPLIDAADDLWGKNKATRAIRVPAVEIAGWTTGPVWFIERADKAFGAQGMSQYMDAEVHGSAGGNLLSPFSLTIDYPHRKAWFSCVSGCKQDGNRVGAR
jgi:hypothetical protein